MEHFRGERLRRRDQCGAAPAPSLRRVAKREHDVGRTLNLEKDCAPVSGSARAVLLGSARLAAGLGSRRSVGAHSYCRSVQPLAPRTYPAPSRRPLDGNSGSNRLCASAIGNLLRRLTIQILKPHQAIPRTAITLTIVKLHLLITRRYSPGGSQLLASLQAQKRLTGRKPPLRTMIFHLPPDFR